MIGLYHISNWPLLLDASKGDMFELMPGRRGAEGAGVYFSEGAPVTITTAEGTQSQGKGSPAAIVQIHVTSHAGWWRTKPALARKFRRPITWHTDGKSIVCSVVALSFDHVDGFGLMPTLRCDWSFGD